MLLAELNNASQAPMDDLIVAVQELVSDIEARTSDLNEEFNARTNRYQSE